MDIRRRKESLERKTLSEFAVVSSQSHGRLREEEECDIRTCFQRDRDRILHCKSFRRLKHKTQVFIAPEGDHYRTRLTHTLEVSQIARTIASSLALNEDLVEAIALGHDLGHTPFGHSGERAINKLNKKGFRHNEQSLRVVDVLESRNDKKGLNLTMEVRDGILNHSGGGGLKSLEGEVVRISDRIAYINHDLDDALRAGLISYEEIDRDIVRVLGEKSSDRIDVMIRDIISSSYGKNTIALSEEVMYYMNNLRNFLFENVYSHRNSKGEEFKVDYIIGELYKYYSKNPDRLPASYYENIGGDGDLDMVITDYIAGMTDRYIINLFKDNFSPDSWGIREEKR